MMGVIDWPNMPDSFIARCQDGTPVRDLDPLIFENLCTAVIIEEWNGR